MVWKGPYIYRALFLTKITKKFFFVQIGSKFVSDTNGTLLGNNTPDESMDDRKTTESSGAENVENAESHHLIFI